MAIYFPFLCVLIGVGLCPKDFDQLEYNLDMLQGGVIEVSQLKVSVDYAEFIRCMDISFYKRRTVVTLQLDDL